MLSKVQILYPNLNRGTNGFVLVSSSLTIVLTVSFLLAWSLAGTPQSFFMKKSLRKIVSLSLYKIKQHKEQIKKFSFTTYKEDFVITEQEEKEGGFFRQKLSHLKIGNAV